MHKLFFGLVFTYFTLLPSVNAVDFGEINFTVNLSKNTMQLLLPIPKDKVSASAYFELFEMDIPIKSRYLAKNIWPSNSEKKYLRVLLIELEHLSGKNVSLKLKWKKSEKTKNFKTNIIINDPILVYPSQSWLSQSLLLHKDVGKLDTEWYTGPQAQYAKYVTNKKLLLQRGYPPEKASQWLFDRPQAIYQLYFMTGNIKWFEEANILAQFYMEHIDEEGFFTLSKKYDPKYFMPKGLLFRYLLTVDDKALQALKKTFYSSLKWDPTYTSNRGFWTERNQAAALNVAVSYWELTNDKRALERINEILNATIEMTFNPENDWALRGCPQHSFKSHEGEGDNSPTCSPWMMALLGDSLWRFYRLTNDIRASSLINAFGDFILNYGIFYGTAAKLKGIVMPKYIASMENPRQEEHNQWTDPQHSCDVAGLLGKSVYIKKKENQDVFLTKLLFKELLEQCQKVYVKYKKEKKNGKLKNHWLLNPPRRFGWMYSTTSDLPWLENLLLNNY